MFSMLLLQLCTRHAVVVAFQCEEVHSENTYIRVSGIFLYGKFTILLLECSKSSYNTDSIVRVKINANNCLQNAENLIIRGLSNDVVAYERCHYCSKS
jgi:hypothetical protein